MIKAIKKNVRKKNTFLVLIFILIILGYNLFFIIQREEASKIDTETNNLLSEIQIINTQSENIKQTITMVENKHNEYISRIESSKAFLIDAVVLNNEITEFVGLLNKYYDNKMFTITLKESKLDDEYLNIGNILFSFKFFHSYGNKPELAKEVEYAILRNVFYDITKNFSKLLSVLDEKSSVNLENKTIAISYLKDK